MNLDNLTIAFGKQWLREHLRKGVTCPLCEQHAQEYRRKINASMANALIQMYRHAGIHWVYLPSIAHKWQGRDEAGLRYWGLIEEATEKREDGGRAGWWRITSAGVRYLLHDMTVPTYAIVYDGKVNAWEGPQVGIKDALGTKFNYSELMAGV